MRGVGVGRYVGSGRARDGPTSWATRPPALRPREKGKIPFSLALNSYLCFHAFPRGRTGCPTKFSPRLEGERGGVLVGACASSSCLFCIGVMAACAVRYGQPRWPRRQGSEGRLQGQCRARAPRLVEGDLLGRAAASAARAAAAPHGERVRPCDAATAAAAPATTNSSRYDQYFCSYSTRTTLTNNY